MEIENDVSFRGDARQPRRPRVSVVIPYFNAAETLGRTLESLLESDCPDLEVICVDDRSTDDSFEVAGAFDAVHACLRNRSGAALARNLGAGIATGEILFFLDADVVVQPDTVSKVADIFLADPGLSACFGAYTPLPEPDNFASIYKNLVHHFTHQTASSNAHTFWCGCGAIRADIFRQIGGFDESYQASSVEDIELGYRMTQAGHRVRLKSEIQVTHAKVYTLGSLIRSDFLDRAVPWTLLMARKNIFYADLNLRLSNIASALLIVLGLPFAIGLMIVLGPRMLKFAPVVVIFAILLLNGGIFRFVLRQKGLWFLGKFILMYMFTYLYSVAGFAVGILLFLRERLFGKGKREG